MTERKARAYQSVPNASALGIELTAKALSERQSSGQLTPTLGETRDAAALAIATTKRRERRRARARVRPGEAESTSARVSSTRG